MPRVKVCGRPLSSFDGSGWFAASVSFADSHELPGRLPRARVNLRPGDPACDPMTRRIVAPTWFMKHWNRSETVAQDNSSSSGNSWGNRRFNGNQRSRVTRRSASIALSLHRHPCGGLPFIKKSPPLNWVSLPFPSGSGTASSSHRSCSIRRDTNTQFSRPALGIVSVAGRASGRAEFPGSGPGDGWSGLPPVRRALFAGFDPAG